MPESCWTEVSEPYGTEKGQALANTFDGNVYVTKEELVPVGVSFYDHSGKLHPCSGMDEKEIWKKAFDLWKTKMLVTLVPFLLEKEAKERFNTIKEIKFKDGYPTDEFRKELEEKNCRLDAERDLLDKQKRNYRREHEEKFIELHDDCAVAFAFAQDDGKVYYSTDSDQLTVYGSGRAFTSRPFQKCSTREKTNRGNVAWRRQREEEEVPTHA